MKKIIVKIQELGIFSEGIFKKDDKGQYLVDPKTNGLIKKEGYTEYTVDVEIGGMIVSARTRALNADEPSILDPSMTAGESLKKREKESEENNYAGLPIMERVPMTSLDDAVKSAYEIIGMHLEKQTDLSEFSQPFFTLQGENTYNISLVKSAEYKTNYKNEDVYYEKSNVVDVPKIKEGDIITLSNGNISFAMIHVFEKSDVLGFKNRGMLGYFKDNFVPIENLESSGFKVTEVRQRKIVKDVFADNPRPSKDLKTFSRKAKPGSLTSLLDARESVKAVYDYFDGRVKNGDFLLDQWMADAYESSKKSMEEIGSLIKAMHPQYDEEDS